MFCNNGFAYDNVCNEFIHPSCIIIRVYNTWPSSTHVLIRHRLYSTAFSGSDKLAFTFFPYVFKLIITFLLLERWQSVKASRNNCLKWAKCLEIGFIIYSFDHNIKKYYMYLRYQLTFFCLQCIITNKSYY